MPRKTWNSPGYHVPVAGFTQAVTTPAAGTLVFVSGLTARRADSAIVAVGDIEGQARQVLENLKRILADLGGTLDDVVRIVTYLRNMEDHPVVHKIRREYFGDRPPASTTVEISRLFDPRQLIEIEATAVISGQPNPKE